MTSLESFLSKRLRLPINREKSAVARPRARKFLGYTVTTSRKLKVAPQSLRRLQGRIRALCRQARGWRLDRLIETLRPIIRGWIAYFQLSEVKVAFVRLERGEGRLRAPGMNGCGAGCAVSCGGSGSDLSLASAV